MIYVFPVRVRQVVVARQPRTESYARMHLLPKILFSCLEEHISRSKTRQGRVTLDCASESVG